MEVIIVKNIEQSKQLYPNYIVIDENNYRQALEKDVSYSENQTQFIDQLAFKEALSEMNLTLGDKKSILFVVNLDDKKLKLIKKTLSYHKVKLIIE